MADFSEESRYPGQQSDLAGQPPQTSKMVHCGRQGNGRKQAGWTGNSCLSLNAEIQRRLKQEEVTQKEYGDCAHAEELEQAKDAKKKQGIVI